MRTVSARAGGCAVAGVLVWLVFEPQFPKVLTGGFDDQWARIELLFFLALGGAIGLVAGLLQGASRGGSRNVVTSGAMGLFFGVIGGGLAHAVGGTMYAMFGGAMTGPISRVAAFVPMGLLIGLAVGATHLSGRGVLSGGLGGLIAGVVCGATFDLFSAMLAPLLLAAGPAVGETTQEVGAPGRAWTAFGLGLGIGLFTALMDRATRQAWLRLVVGRNEGREWPIDTAQTTIGRDERAQVPLFGDPNVPPLAATIVRQGPQYVLVDAGTPMGVGHNGIRVAQAVLQPGDTIQVGSLNLQFLMKAGAARRAREGRGVGAPIGGAPHPPLTPVAPVSQLSVVGQPSTVSARTLVATAGPLTGQRFSVTTEVVVGREGDAVRLGFDQQASRRHCRLAPEGTGLRVTDLGSTNGTFVNGQRTSSALLEPGDVLQVGGSTFRVE